MSRVEALLSFVRFEENVGNLGKSKEENGLCQMVLSDRINRITGSNLSRMPNV
jgi:hypothetical protein